MRQTAAWQISSGFVCARLALFCLNEWPFATIRAWALAAGHDVATLVTPPTTTGMPDFARALERSGEHQVISFGNVDSVRAALSELELDLTIVFGFHRVPDSVASIPRHMSVNLHPSLLPAYRGPNVHRALYDGVDRLGATLHRLTGDFDAGPILAQHSVPTPVDVSPTSTRTALRDAIQCVLSAGVPRALADEQGSEQPPAPGAPRATGFSADEAILEPSTDIHLFQCRLSALVLAGVQPMIRLNGEPEPIMSARRLSSADETRGPGRGGAQRAILRLMDGTVEIRLGRLPF